MADRLDLDLFDAFEQKTPPPSSAGPGRQPKRQNALDLDLFDQIERDYKQPARTLGGTAKDIGISAIKGAIGVPEAAVGLADLATGGRAGKFVEDSLGFRPRAAKEILSSWHSPAQQYAQRQVAEAKGFRETILKSLQNPSTIAAAVTESLPAMAAGGAVGRGVSLATKAAPWVAGAIGEGVIGAGLSAEDTRQQTQDRLLSGRQSAMAAASGAFTGLITMVGGRVAQKFGFDDINTLLAGGKKTTSERISTIAGRIAAGGVSEGVFEEMPQSMQEQLWQNAALGRPVLEGVAEAGAQGLLAGSVMGGAVNMSGSDAGKSGGGDSERNHVKNRNVLELKKLNLPPEELETLKQDTELLARKGLRPQDIDAVIRDRAEGIAKARKELNPADGPVSRAALGAIENEMQRQGTDKKALPAEAGSYQGLGAVDPVKAVKQLEDIKENKPVQRETKANDKKRNEGKPEQKAEDHSGNKTVPAFSRQKVQEQKEGRQKADTAGPEIAGPADAKVGELKSQSSSELPLENKKSQAPSHEQSKLKKEYEKSLPEVMTKPVNPIPGKIKTRPDDYSSPQAGVSSEAARDIIKFGRTIPDSKVYTDPHDPGLGRQQTPRVTLQKGLKINDQKDLESLSSISPIISKIGSISVIEYGKYDTVVAELDSASFKNANSRIDEIVEGPGEQSRSNPYVTIAQVKKGEGKKYLGNASLAGREIQISHIEVTDRNNRTHEVVLKGAGNAARPNPERKDQVKPDLTGPHNNAITKDAVKAKSAAALSRPRAEGIAKSEKKKDAQQAGQGTEAGQSSPGTPQPLPSTPRKDDPTKIRPYSGSKRKLKEYDRNEIEDVPLLDAVGKGLISKEEAAVVDGIIKQFPSFKDHLEVMISGQEFKPTADQVRTAGISVSGIDRLSVVGSTRPQWRGKPGSGEVKQIITMFKGHDVVDFIHEFGEFIYERALDAQDKQIVNTAFKADKAKKKSMYKNEWFATKFEQWWVGQQPVNDLALAAIFRKMLRLIKNIHARFKEVTGTNVPRELAALFDDIVTNGRDIVDKYAYSADEMVARYITGIEPDKATISRQGLSKNQKTGWSFDPSSMCPKQEAFVSWVGEQLRQGNIDNQWLTDPKNIAGLYDAALAEGVEVPCSYCYVEGARRKALAYYHKSKGKRTLVRFSQAKVVVREVPYVDKILKLPRKTIEEMNERGGLRLFSFSDYIRSAHRGSIDTLLRHAKKRGLSIKAITKNPEFVEDFGDTGITINVSIDFADQGFGVPWDKAAELKKKYPNVKIRTVARNFNEVKKALEQPIDASGTMIDVVTPYHHEGAESIPEDHQEMSVGSKGGARITELVKDNPEYGKRLCCREGGKCLNLQKDPVTGKTHASQCASNCGGGKGMLTIPDVRSGNQEVRLSLGTGEQGTLAKVLEELGSFLGWQEMDNLVAKGTLTVLKDHEAAGKILGRKIPENSRLQGFTSKGKVYLISGRINKGESVKVLKHELGLHVKQLLQDDALFKELQQTLKNRQTQKSRTGEAIRAAMKRVPEGTEPTHYWEEVAAYMIEAQPDNVSLVRRVLTKIKKILVDMGFSPGLFTVEDLNTMAVSAIRSKAGNNRFSADKEEIKYSVSKNQGEPRKRDTGESLKSYLDDVLIDTPEGKKSSLARMAPHISAALNRRLKKQGVTLKKEERSKVSGDAGLRQSEKLKTAKGAVSQSKLIKKLQGYEEIVAKLQNDAIDTREKVDALVKYIIKAPRMVRGHAHVQSLYNQLVNARTDAARLKVLAKGLDRVDFMNEEWTKRQAIAGIVKNLTKNAPKIKDQIAKQTRGGYTLFHEMRAIARVMKMRNSQVMARMDELMEKAAGQTLEIEEAGELRRLTIYGGLLQATAEQAVQANRDLDRMIKLKKVDWYQEMAKLKLKRDRLKTEMSTIITGGKGPKSENERQKDLQEQRKFSRIIGDGLRSFDDKNQSFEWLLDKLSRFDKGSKILGSKLTTSFNRLVTQATRDEQTGVGESYALLQQKLAEIYGVSGRKLEKRISVNADIKSDSGIYRRDQQGEKLEEIPMSQNQAYKRWMEWQDPTLQEQLALQGYTAETMREIESFMSKEVRAWAEWQLGEFYPDYYGGVNEVFKKLFFTDMPHNEFYSPIRRNYGKGKEDDNLLMNQSHFSSVINGHVRQRIANTRDILLQDGDFVLARHIQQMEHFKAWAIPVQQLRSILGSETVRTAIKDYHGTTALRTLTGFIDDFARGKAVQTLEAEWMQQMRGRFTTAVVGLNPVVFLKQLTSVPAYASDIPVADWLQGVAAWPKEYKEAIKTLSDSKMIKARYNIGFERDLVIAMDAGIKGKLSGTRKLSDTSMFLTKWGDRIAIYFGGWPVYKYHHNKVMNAGSFDELPESYRDDKLQEILDHPGNEMASEKQIGMVLKDKAKRLVFKNWQKLSKKEKENIAREEAMEQFEMATERSQQAAGIKDMNAYQRGGPFVQLFTMFMTAPNMYYRAWSGGFRNLTGTRTDKKAAAKRIFITQIVLPMLFQWVASGFEWEEDEQLRAVLFGPLNGLFMFRDLGLGVYDKLAGNTIWNSPGTPPVFTTVTEAGRAWSKLKYFREFSEKPLDEWLFDKDMWEMVHSGATVAGNLTGLPVGPAGRWAEGIYDSVKGQTVAPGRRLLGFSETKLDGARKDYLALREKITAAGQGSRGYTAMKNFEKQRAAMNTAIKNAIKSGAPRTAVRNLYNKREQAHEAFVSRWSK